MNQEQLHDALNLLDDDMIETVDDLRHEKPRRGVHWKPLISAAACLCIVLFGVLAASRFGVSFFKGEKKHGGASSSELYQEELVLESGALEESFLAGDERSSITPSAAEEETSGAQLESRGEELPSVLIKIESWQENGFRGTVTEIVDTEILKPGTEVTVCFTQDVKIERRDGDVVYYESRVPDSCDFPLDSVVRIQFRTWDNANNEEPDNNSGYILYAECIAMEDTGAE